MIFDLNRFETYKRIPSLLLFFQKGVTMLDVVMDPNKYYLCGIKIEDKVIYDCSPRES